MSDRDDRVASTADRCRSQARFPCDPVDEVLSMVMAKASAPRQAHVDSRAPAVGGQPAPTDVDRPFAPMNRVRSVTRCGTHWGAVRAPACISHVVTARTAP